MNEDMAEPQNDETQISHKWFEWLLESSLKEAVAKHGDAGRMVAWDVRESFVERLPRGTFAYHGPDAFEIGCHEAGATNQSGKVKP